jgi:glycosyltransferase involved in cell wall biosynthesis
MKKILFCIGEGIGNIAQMLPSFLYLKRKYKGRHISVMNIYPSWSKEARLFFEPFADEYLEDDHGDFKEYEGKFVPPVLSWVKKIPLPILNKSNTNIHCEGSISEVEANFKIIGDDYKDYELCDFGGLFEDEYECNNEFPDIIIHNGFSKVVKGKWYAKSYSRFDEVVDLAKKAGYSVGSIGSKDEYIEGTEDLTGLDLRESIEILKNAKHLLCTATSTFHLANMVGCKNTGIWTFNGVTKNFDSRFHRFSQIARLDLECSPCQHKGNDFWIKNKPVCNWACRDIDPHQLFDTVDSSIKKIERETLTNSAIIFIPQRNASQFVEKCLDSVLIQDYKDLGIIFIDDSSEDNTVDLALKKINGRADVVFKVNSSRQPKIVSLKQAISEICINPNSAMFWLDGDDWLMEKTAISEMMSCHEDYDIVWSQFYHKDLKRTGCCGPLQEGDHRKNLWRSSAMRSFKKYLFDQIEDHSLRNNNEYLESAIDMAIMFPMLEMAGREKCHYLDRVFYFYNTTPNCMHGTREGATTQKGNEMIVRGKNPYEPKRLCKISVVIPCYNQSSFLARSVSSVVSQSFKEYEIIIVNDGSTDNCVDVVKSLQKRFNKEKIILIDQKNMGLSAARNAGIRVASSEWILPLDADDYIKPKMLELCYKKAKDKDADVVYTDVYLMREGLNHKMKLEMDLILFKRNCLVCTSLFKKSMWEEVGGYHEGMKNGYEDWDFWLSCIENDAVFEKQDGYLFVYDNTRESMSSSAYRNHESLLNTLKRNHPRMVPTEGKTLSVVMSSYNQLNSLKYALRAIENQSVRPLEVILSDDGSTDGTIEWLDSEDCNFSFDLKYVTREHSGYGLATIHNEAVSFARGDRILFTNGDVMHSPNSIKSHAELDDLTIGGGIIDGIGVSGVDCLNLKMLSDFSNIKKLRDKCPSSRNNYSFIRGKTTPLGIWGGNFSVSSKKFKEVNGYNVKFDKAYGAEDADLAERVIKMGGTIKWIKNSLGVHIDHDIKVYVQSSIGSKKYYESKKR